MTRMLANNTILHAFNSQSITTSQKEFQTKLNIQYWRRAGKDRTESREIVETVKTQDGR